MKDKPFSGKKVLKAAADIRAVIEGTLEQAGNGMDMMANHPGDGKTLGRRISEKRRELRERIDRREREKTEKAAVATVTIKKRER